jgi:hypothetical protein
MEEMPVIRTDIDQTFIRTLLLELQQLRKRHSAGVNPLTGTENAGLQSGPCECSPADEIIRKRIAQLEGTLGTLESKIQADIAELEARLGSLKTPGLFSFLTSEGRLSRMLISELNIKYAALNIIQGKHPPPFIKKFFWPASAAIIAVIILAATLWTVFSLRDGSQPIPATPPATASTYTNAEKDIDTIEVINLLEDIKKANLNKDLSLWEASYSKGYLALADKRESIQKLWRSFDYTSLEYQIVEMNISASAAHALITWAIELRERKTGKIMKRSEQLSADFIRENNELKISAIRKNAP